MKVLLKVPLSSYSGYGNDGIGITQALIRAGVDVYLQPTHVDPPLPPEVASLLTKRLVAPFDLLIHHVDPDQLGLKAEAYDASTVCVGWTMWEYSTADNMEGKGTLRHRLEVYDAVLAYDHVTKGVLSPFVRAGVLGTVQGGFWPESWPSQERDWFSDRFGFCMVGQLHERKDPWTAIEAFNELKMEYPEEFFGAELHLKTNIPVFHPMLEESVPRLRVHCDNWPQDVLLEFYKKQHVLLAPSRGEGKNLPALEMLSTGGTVIATNWGGHEMWMSKSHAVPLNYVLRPLDGGHPDCLNARPDKDHLKSEMLRLYRDRAAAKMLGDAAARTIPAMCNWDSVLGRFFNAVADLVPVHGPRLRAEYLLSGGVR